MRYHIKRYHSAFPIKCTVCDHSENNTSGLLCEYEVQGENRDPPDRGPIALDCEMVGVGPKLLNALGRISIVDYSGNVLYDVMVRPEEEITDFRTRWSGIRPEDMRRAIPFECAQEQVERIIHVSLSVLEGCLPVSL
ncbi:RNA exonuclease 4 [Fasciolopsis buskii]|uniref:RNA exonuclease 4 n=1 Tax=Fasciolopsis buskii TaxID=27845 RepID=A0A8E0VNY8_9TREM|nr:RNA exonuclease 4 [Fasciolopsis buski]